MTASAAPDPTRAGGGHAVGVDGVAADVGGGGAAVGAAVSAGSLRGDHFSYRSISGPLAITFAFFTTVGMFHQLATATLVDRLGAGERYVGWSLGVTMGGAIVGRIVGGSLVDKLGERIGFLVASALVLVAGLLMVVPATVATFLAGRAMHGFGEAMSYVCAATAVMNRSPLNRRSRLLGLLGSAVWGGLALGPALGELLGTSERAGALTVVVGSLGVVLAGRIGDGQPLPSSQQRRLFAFRFPRPALLPSVTIGFYNLAFAAINSYVILHMRAEGLDPWGALTVYAIAVLCGRLLLGGIPDRLGPRPSLVVGLSMMFVSMTVVAFAPNRLAVLIALGLFGIGYSMPFPALAALAVDRTRESERASTLATVGLVYDVFVLAAGGLYGALSDAGHLTAVMWVGLAGIGVGLALALTVTRAVEPAR